VPSSVRERNVWQPALDDREWVRYHVEQYFIAAGAGGAIGSSRADAQENLPDRGEAGETLHDLFDAALHGELVHRTELAPLLLRELQQPAHLRSRPGQWLLAQHVAAGGEQLFAGVFVAGQRRANVRYCRVKPAEQASQVGQRSGAVAFGKRLRSQRVRVDDRNNFRAEPPRGGGMPAPHQACADDGNVGSARRGGHTSSGVVNAGVGAASRRGHLAVRVHDRFLARAIAL
jgi:hypothetical protein